VELQDYVTLSFKGCGRTSRGLFDSNIPMLSCRNYGNFRSGQPKGNVEKPHSGQSVFQQRAELKILGIQSGNASHYTTLHYTEAFIASN